MLINSAKFKLLYCFFPLPKILPIQAKIEGEREKKGKHKPRRTITMAAETFRKSMDTLSVEQAAQKTRKEKARERESVGERTRGYLSALLGSVLISSSLSSTFCHRPYSSSFFIVISIVIEIQFSVLKIFPPKMSFTKASVRQKNTQYHVFTLKACRSIPLA